MKLLDLIIEKKIQPIPRADLKRLIEKKIQPLFRSEYKSEKLETYTKWLKSMIRITNEGTRLRIEADDKVAKKFEKSIMPLLKAWGWFVAYREFVSYKYDPEKYVLFRLGANYDIRVAGKEMEYLFKFYHVTPTSNVPTILRKGLIPKVTKKWATAPPRIYLTNSKAMAKKLADDFADYTPGQKEWSILEIDPKKWRKGTKIFKDPEAARSFYTSTHIPPQAINKNNIIRIRTG